MLNCKDITEKANDYLDQELPFWTRFKFQLHLKMCNNCQRYVEQLNLTIAVLRKMGPNTQVSEAEMENIVANIVNNTKNHTGNDPV